MSPYPQETADLVTFTEEIVNGKLNFLCKGLSYKNTHNSWMKRAIFILFSPNKNFKVEI